jgi:hypothetical protein
MRRAFIGTNFEAPRQAAVILKQPIALWVLARDRTATASSEGSDGIQP